MLKDLVSLAPMNSYVISSLNKPIIATHSLSTCIGIILTDNNNYILAHLSTDISLLKEIVNLLNKGLINVYIIPGFYKNKERINNIINYLLDRNNFLLYDFSIKIINLDKYKNLKYEDISFGYDTRTKKFLKIDFEELLKEDISYGRK